MGLLWGPIALWACGVVVGTLRIALWSCFGVLELLWGTITLWGCFEDNSQCQSLQGSCCGDTSHCGNVVGHFCLWICFGGTLHCVDELWGRIALWRHVVGPRFNCGLAVERETRCGEHCIENTRHYAKK